MKSRLHLVALILLAAYTGICGATDETVTVVVDASHPGPGSIATSSGSSPSILARAFTAASGSGRTRRSPTCAAFAATWSRRCAHLKVPNVRWPGGCFADEYHWRDGIGPEDKRKSSINANWGGAVEPNTFGTHEFMDFIEQIGAEAYVSVNVGSGHGAGSGRLARIYDGAPATDDAGKRARQPTATPRPIAIRYLGLGNESWGCGGAMTPEHYVEPDEDLRRYRPQLQSVADRRSRDAAHRGRLGRRRARDYTEAVMKAWNEQGLELGHRGPVAARLHGPQDGRRVMPSSASARTNMP